QELVALSMTARERAIWIHEHADEIAQAGEWVRRVWVILYYLYSLRLPFTASELCQLIGTLDARPPVARMVEYFHDHGLTTGALYGTAELARGLPRRHRQRIRSCGCPKRAAIARHDALARRMG